MTQNQEHPNPKNPGFNKAKMLISGGIAIAIAGVAYGVYSFIYTPPQNLSPSKSAQLVPDEALLTSYLYTDTDAWSKLQEFGSPQLKELIKKKQPNWQQLFEENNINFQQDIQSWAGGIMLAYLPNSESSSANSGSSNSNRQVQSTSKPNSEQKTGNVAPPEGSFLAVVGIQNKAKALSFLNNKVKDQESVEVEKTQYKGVTIFEVTQPDSTNYVARLNNHVLVSGSNQNIEQAIDTSNGEASFADNAGASNILQQGTQIKNPIAEVYIADYFKLFQELSKSSSDTPQFSEDTLSQLQKIKQMAAGVGVDDEGIRMRFLSKIDPSNLPDGYNETSPGKVLQQFPQDTIALITGIGIDRVWSQLNTQAEKSPEVKQVVGLVRSTLQSFGLDADKDVFGWMDGEFGIGSVALSSNSGIFGQFGMGVGVVMETSDRARAESTLEKVQDIAKKQAPYLKFGETKVGNVPITQWKLSEQQTILGHGWLDDNSVFIALGNGLASNFATNREQNLSNSSQFQEVTKTLPQSNAGYFYLNMDKVVSVVNELPQVSNRGMPLELKAVFNSMNGIGVTANWQDKSTSQLEMLVSLKKTSEVSTNNQQSKPEQSTNQ